MTDVSAVEEMRDHLIVAMGERAPGETIERCLERAARALGIPFSRARNYWWRRVRRVDVEEADAVRARAAEIRRERLQQMVADYEREAAAYEALRTQLLATAPRVVRWLVPPPAPTLGDLPGSEERTPRSEGAAE